MSENLNKKRKRLRAGNERAVIALVCIFSVMVVLVCGVLYSCYSETDPIDNAEELRAYIDSHPASDSATSVEEILSKWKLPKFTRGLLLGVERCYELYYYKDIPSPQELAYTTAMNFIDEKYETTDKSDPTSVAHDIIDCYIMAIGDPYSFYRSAEEYEDYSTDMSGQFAGIGVSVETSLKDGGILVINAIKDSPAEAAGITPGDLIIKVGDKLVSDIGYDSAVNLIRGEIGTAVEITVKRADEEFELSIVRALVTEQSVGLDWLEGDVAYIQITSFKSNTAEQFILAVNEAEAAGAKGIIFDLRYNPGGYLTAICASLSYLVPDETPLASFSSDKTPILASSGDSLEPTDHVLSIPSVVICNRYTASAGELFTAALADFNDMELITAVTVGETTYKKGVMQTTYMFEDDSAITLTTAYYNPPSGVNYDGIGVVPDIPLGEDEDFLSEAYEQMLAILSARD